ncbi:hypothetical protein Tco_1156062 [Tanacetum coccineum]
MSPTNDKFQPWRALTTIINLCLTGKTSGFERPRAPVLQILWGVVNRAHICGKNLLIDNISLATATQLPPIPEFPNSSGLLKEPVLGNLKFSAKGTKREVFGMTIPNELINDVIRGANYYEAYLNKVTSHQRYLPSEEMSDPDSPAPKPAKLTIQTKPKPTKGSAAEPRLERPGVKRFFWKRFARDLTDAYLLKGGPSPHPVVFRETDTGNFQPLPEVPGKGKEKVGEEQEPNDTESDEEMPSVVRSGAQDEGQAGPDPGTLDEGQAGPNPDDVAESQPLPTPSVLVRPNLEHSDENLKLTINEQVIPEEPVSSTGTLSSLQHLAKDFSFGDQFLNDKPSEADNEKTTVDTEAESMVSVTIQQDISVIPPMTSPVIGPMPRLDSPNIHWPLPTTTTTTATTTTTLPLPPQPQQGPSDPIIIKRMGELEEFIANLVEENQALETR